MFLSIVIIALLFGLAYTWILRNIYTDWVDVPVWIIPKAYRPQAKVTILVPARNESDHILRCAESLLDQVWPSDKLEIIILDDDSTDDTAELVEAIDDERISLIKMAEIDPHYSGPAYKKRALSVGVNQAQGKYILTTDADCTHHKHWLASMVSLAERKDKEFVTGPVRVVPARSGLEKYQALDALGMNAVNAAGLHKRTRAVSCGANTLFSKSIFDRVNGFENVSNIATGDDVFLAEKIMGAAPDTMYFNKSREAIVDTSSVNALPEIIRQRHRWAVKFKHLSSQNTKRLMFFIGLYYAVFWISILCAVLISYQFLFITTILFFFKLRSDFWFLRQLCGEFEQNILSGFPMATILSYVVEPIVAVKSIFQNKYMWKDRLVK